jgi:hypothetical protein
MGLELFRDTMKAREPLVIYIAGPMRGHEDDNYPAFYEAEEMLRAKGIWLPVNPARMDEELVKFGDIVEVDYKLALKRDIDEIFEADAMYMLKGWEKSEGARVEHALAIYLGLSIMYQ